MGAIHIQSQVSFLYLPNSISILTNCLPILSRTNLIYEDRCNGNYLQIIALILPLAVFPVIF